MHLLQHCLDLRCRCAGNPANSGPVKDRRQNREQNGCGAGQGRREVADFHDLATIDRSAHDATYRLFDGAFEVALQEEFGFACRPYSDDGAQQVRLVQAQQVRQKLIDMCAVLLIEVPGDAGLEFLPSGRIHGFKVNGKVPLQGYRAPPDL